MHEKSKCIKCGETIHSNLNICPYCGKKNQKIKDTKKRKKNKIIIVLGVLFTIVLLPLLLYGILFCGPFVRNTIIAVIGIIIFSIIIVLLDESKNKN